MIEGNRVQKFFIMNVVSCYNVVFVIEVIILSIFQNYKKVQDQVEEVYFGVRVSFVKFVLLSGKKVERSFRMSNIGGNGQNLVSRSLYLCDVVMQYLGVLELICNGNINVWFVVFNGIDKDLKFESIKFVMFEKENVCIGRELMLKFFQFQFQVLFWYLV